MMYTININRSNIEYLDTSNVTRMENGFGAFGDCNDGSQTLNLSGWDTSHVTNMGLMFFTSRIQTIYASNRFVTTAVVDKGVSNGGDDTMFTGLYNIVGGNGTTFSYDHQDSDYARIDAPGTPGYFTLKS